MFINGDRFLRYPDGFKNVTDESEITPKDIVYEWRDGKIVEVHL